MKEKCVNNEEKKIQDKGVDLNFCGEDMIKSTNSPFKVSIVEKIVWDGLAVAKITKYPPAKKSCNPFAQARICYEPGVGFHFRMWSFEVNPVSECREYNSEDILTDSMLTVLVNFYPETSKKVIQMNFNKDGFCRLRMEKNDKEIEMWPDRLNYSEGDKEFKDFKIERFTGEDLQGIYWGIEFVITCELIAEVYEKERYDFKSGDKIGVNFVKECRSIELFHEGGFCELKEDDRYGSLRLSMLVEY